MPNFASAKILHTILICRHQNPAKNASHDKSNNLSALAAAAERVSDPLNELNEEILRAFQGLCTQ